MLVGSARAGTPTFIVLSRGIPLIADARTFFEFDEGEQDPNLFVLPQQIVNTCNQWP
jgi:hypothetical protein